MAGKHRTRARGRAEPDRHAPNLNRSLRLPADDGPAMMSWLTRYAAQQDRARTTGPRVTANSLIIDAMRAFIRDHGGAGLWDQAEAHTTPLVAADRVPGLVQTRRMAGDPDGPTSPLGRRSER